MRNFMKKKFTLLMASMMLLGASAAQAWTDAGCCYEDPCCEDQTGFYIGGFGGASFISTSKSCGRNKRHFDTGYVLSASLGYRWCHNVRVEFEYAYRNNKVRHRNSSIIARDGESCGKKHRSFFQNAYMFNGIYDLDMCNDWCVKPYIGAGIGYAQNRNGHHNFHNFDAVSSESRRHRRDKNGLAWQIIAGLAYPICDEVDLSIEYRFFKARDHHLSNNDIGVGLRYYF